MSLRQRYLKLLSEIMPAGAVGISLLLGSAAPGDAARHPADSRPAAADLSNVAERLAAIREAVSDLAGEVVKSRPDEQQLAWGNWWRNGGWRGPGWRNGGWSNWRNGWRNGGWRNWWHNW
jgi:rSAM-associated Gly-rich repeat protein